MIPAYYIRISFPMSGVILLLQGLLLPLKYIKLSNYMLDLVSTGGCLYSYQKCIFLVFSLMFSFLGDEPAAHHLQLVYFQQISSWYLRGACEKNMCVLEKQNQFGMCLLNRDYTVYHTISKPT